MRRLLHGVVVVLVVATVACKTDETIAIHSLEIKGAHSIDADALKAALATREDPKLPVLNVRLPWAKKRNFFDRNRFDADLKRVEAFYADRGYPNARVTSFDVKLNNKHDAVDVTITVDEGTPVRVASVNLQGFDVVIPASHFDALQRELPLQVGEPRDRQAVLTAHDMALNELRDHGYPYARVTTEENDGPDGKQAAITFTAQAGLRANFGDIEISGNTSVSDDVIRRQLLYKPGDLYQRSAIQDSQRRLYGMELFQFVNVETVNAETQDAEVKTKITVVEGKHQRVNMGVGYGTEEKGRVDAEYHHVNFLGGARSAGVHGRWSSLDRGVRADFTQPYFFRPTFSLGGEGQRWYTFTPAYKSIITGGKLSLTQQISSRTSWTVSMSEARTLTSILIPPSQAPPSFFVDLIALGLDPTTLSQSGTLGSVGLDWQRTTTDNALNARHGYQIAIHSEKAGQVLPSTFNYFALSSDVRYFLPIGKRIVVANRLLLGNIRPAGYVQAEVPFSKKFFLGGATSLRGWGRFEVSPLAAGEPVGGDTMFSFSTEARAPLKGKLGGVLFLDTGNVWTDLRAVNFGDIRYAVGAGLRYSTPVGPIRLDWGYQLNPIPGLLVNGQPQARRWRVHFSIGQAF